MTHLKTDMYRGGGGGRGEGGRGGACVRSLSKWSIRDADIRGIRMKFKSCVERSGKIWKLPGNRFTWPRMIIEVRPWNCIELFSSERIEIVPQLVEWTICTYCRTSRFHYVDFRRSFVRFYRFVFDRCSYGKYYTCGDRVHAMRIYEWDIFSKINATTCFWFRNYETRSIILGRNFINRKFSII